MSKKVDTTTCNYPNPSRCICRERGEDDDWWINSPDHNNCFWTYLVDNPEPHTLQSIADLLSMSISAVTTIEKRVVAKLKKRIKIISEKS